MRVLITGALGLVGSNYAAHCLRRGDSVVALDNNARGESNRENSNWLFTQMSPGSSLKIVDGDVSVRGHVDDAMAECGNVDLVVHAAAQSSVDKSMVDPELDFRWNVIGTFNVLEAIRVGQPTASMIYIASNKIWDVTGWPVERTRERYFWLSRRVGPGEQFPFHTDAKEPYGASKIAGFYYARCYAAMYGVNVVITVPSGMAGPRQYGKSAQGWLGWFTIATMLGLPIKICGDGAQVRDMLHVYDVCTAFDLLHTLSKKYPGEVFNLGGGPRNAISLIEALEKIHVYTGNEPKIEYDDWRPQDNRVYISNIERLIGEGWSPKVGIDDLIKSTCDWVRSELPALKRLYLDR
ncbi:MAG: NAD-dependent epimerase/dehydratase family protein [Pseudomonadota bacterium]|nr:NAD-dependent epimerase/dehydratase family protein [Pseudomonadota bacterium]